MKTYAWLEVAITDRDASGRHNTCETERYRWEQAPPFFELSTSLAYVSRLEIEEQYPVSPIRYSMRRKHS
jgi:hypothetical protein